MSDHIRTSTRRSRVRWLAVPASACLCSWGMAAVPFAPSAVATTVEQNDTAANFSYDGSWTYTTTATNYLNGDAHWSTTAGATAYVTFTGPSVSLVGGENPGHGRADVQVCDSQGQNCGPATIMDTYSSTTLTQQVIYSASGLGSGAHALKITVRSDTSGTDHFTDVDGVVYDNGIGPISGTHYIDNSASSNCSDAGDGNSPSTPWCDFDPLNGASLEPGAQILLNRGDTWTQPLSLTGSGTSSSWITLGAYGSGNRPVIRGNDNASDRTVVLNDVDYWHVQDLELSDAGEGLLVMYTSLNHAGLDIHDIYAHSLSGIVNRSPVQADFPQLQYSTGILIDASAAPITSAGQTVLSDAFIENNEVYNAVAGIHVNDDPGVTGTPQSATSTFTGVNIIHNWIHQSVGPEMSLEAASSPHVASNYLDCSGSVHFPQGTTCFFVSDVDRAFIQNNVMINMPDTSSADETGMDLEFRISNAQVHGNYFGDNAGAGIELLQLAGRPGDYSTGNDISDNTFFNNGTATTSQKGQIAVYNDSGTTPPAAAIHDNGYNATADGFISNVNSDPDLSDVSQSNNAVTTSQYVAPIPFNATQGNGGWHEQGYDLSSWSDMTTYTAATNTWSGRGGSYLNAFELLPGSGQTNDAWVAREWVAPSAGTIVVHGRAFMDDIGDGGDGVQVLIELNGVAQWPANPTYLTYQSIAAADQSGYSTDVTLSVNAGDVIRFVVHAGPAFDNTGDLTSWSPSISYVS